MDDSEVGELWKDAVGRDAEDSELMEYADRVRALIRKLVEERAKWHHNQRNEYPIDCEHRALHDFGILPETWK